MDGAALRRRVAYVLLVAGAAISVAGLAVELVHLRSHAEVVETLVELFSLSYEENVPTWYASSLLLVCALVLGAIATDAPTFRRHWWGLAAGFLVMSIDEAVELHEHAGGHLDLGGVLYFDWVVPAAALLAVLAVVYLPFVRALPVRRQRWFVAAGAIYVGGAVGLELPLGWWTEHWGNESAGYALIDWVEETLELVGVSLFLLALVERWQDRAEASP